MTDKPKRPRDANQLAKFIVDMATGDELSLEIDNEGEEARSPSDFGREGGKVGGQRRAKALSAERRKEIASKAARARWNSDG